MAEVVAWRLVRQRHAATSFSGEGARIFEGRWNSAGVPVVYCSENLALAALEILVHVQPMAISTPFHAFRVILHDSFVNQIQIEKLPKGWNLQPPTAVSKKVGDEWVKSRRSVALALPSVLVPLEKTYLLNPKHPQFGKLRIEDLGIFRLDPRLR
jgi:RES domain-containing protein